MSRPPVGLALCLRSQPERHSVRTAALPTRAALRDVLPCLCLHCLSRLPSHKSAPKCESLRSPGRGSAHRLSCYLLQPLSYIVKTALSHQEHMLNTRWQSCHEQRARQLTGLKFEDCQPARADMASICTAIQPPAHCQGAWGVQRAGS